MHDLEIGAPSHSMVGALPQQTAAFIRRFLGVFYLLGSSGKCFL